MRNNIFLKFGLIMFFFLAVFTVSSFAAGKAYAIDAIITPFFHNNGDAPTTVQISEITNRNGVKIWGPGSVNVGAFGTASLPSRFDSPDMGNYYVHYTPTKTQGADPRDSGCLDPIAPVEFGFYDPTEPPVGGNMVYSNSSNPFTFACWIPVVTNPGTFSLANETTACVAGGSASATATLSWYSSSNASSYDVYYGVNGGAIVLQANAGGALSWTSSNFTPGTQIQWKIKANSSSGGYTYSNETWTFPTASPCPPAANSYSLNVSVSGNGVVSATNGTISCPGTCSNTYTSGTQITLTASPNSGSTFAGWGGACSGTGNCVVTMNSNQSVSATFNTSGGTNDFTLTGGGFSGSITVASGTTVIMLWTHSSGSAARTSCSASSNPNISSWTNGTPSSTSLMANGTGHGASSTVTTTLTMTCNYGSGNTPVSKTFTINISGTTGGLTCSPSSTFGNTSNYFTFYAAGGTTYSWSAPGSVPSSGSASSFTAHYGTAGTYAITLSSPGLTNATCTVTVNSIAGSPPVVNMPTGGIFTWVPTSPNIIYYWSGAPSCTKSAVPANANWTGVVNANNVNGANTGSYQTYSTISFSVSTTFTLTCTGAGGTTAAQTSYVKAPANPIATVPGCGSGNYTAVINWTNTSESGWGIQVDNGIDQPIGSGITSASISGAPFLPGGTYTWNMYVRYINNFGQNAIWTSTPQTFTVGPCPPAPPSGLSATSTCPGGVLTVKFFWADNASSETNYYVDVTPTTSGWGTWTHTTAVQTPANSTSFTWTASNQLTNTGGTGGAALSPAANTSYYWRANAHQDPSTESQTYYGNTATPPGTAFAVGDPCGTTAVSAVVSGSCAAGYTVTFNWTGSPALWINVMDSAHVSFIANKDISANGTGTTTIPPASNPAGYVFTGGTYGWNIWMGGAASNVVWGSNFIIPSCTPGGLTVTTNPSTCSGTPYSATFKWSNGVVAGSNWWVDIDNNNNWDNNGDGIADADSQIPVPSGTAGSTGVALSNWFQPGVTYRWVIYYGSGSGATAKFVVPDSNDVTNAQLIAGSGFTPSAAYTFTVPGCFDLKASFSPSVGTYSDGQTAQATIVVTNLGNTSTPAATTVGIWKRGVDSGFPSCPGTTGGALPASQTHTVPILAPLGTDSWTYSFTVGNTPGTFYLDGYVIPGCSISGQPDSVWTNNATTASGNLSFTYQVNVDGWFQTSGADVGVSSGNVTMKQVPPSGSNVVSAGPTNKPLLISAGIPVAGSGGTTQQLSGYVSGVTFKTYNKSLMPAGAYTYLAERFLGKATNQNASCAVQTGLNKCAPGTGDGNGTWTFAGGTAPTGNSVIFVQGNLVITGPITAAGNNTITFIVSKDISVNTNVSQLDGLYIAGGSFTDTDAATGIAGPQLVVNGAVYANLVTLSRVLGGTCSVNCSNALFPAESFVFDPKYLLNLGSILGTPAVSWQEVAP